MVNPVEVPLDPKKNTPKTPRPNPLGCVAVEALLQETTQLHEMQLTLETGYQERWVWKWDIP